jgi:hypothetical protein
VLVAGGVVAALALNNVNNPATTVTNYYNAIESQDYNSAFTYLDTSAITFQGRTITPQLFSQAGQVVDQTKGKVTAFSIANTSTNSNNGNSTAQVTVSVTRNNTSYDVHLGLRQESSGWKITSLDNL